MTDIPSELDKRQRHATDPMRRQKAAQFMIDLAMVVTLTAFVVVIITIWAAWNLRSEWIELRNVILERAEASDVVRRSDADGRALLTALEQIARAAGRWEADMDRREAPAQIRQQREQHGTAPENRSLNELFGTGGFSRRSGQDARDDGQ